ncbi:hypothetical protein PR048_022254, partial [Dryococelus australis]
MEWNLLFTMIWTRTIFVEFVSERIIKLTINCNGGKKTHILQVYAPEVGCSDEENRYDTVLGPHSFRNKNVEGGHLLDFCIRNSFVISNRWFEKRNSHKITRYSWDEPVGTMIDYIYIYILADKPVWDLIQDLIPSEHQDGDHCLLVADIKKKKPKKMKIDRYPKS